MISRAILYITTLILMIAVGWMGLGSIVIASTTISKVAPGVSLVAASCSGAKCIACNELQQLNSSSQQCSNASTSINSIVYGGVNVLSIIVGIVAVVMIIISGFRFIISGGDSNGVSNARKTLIYALIGLAIAALAEILVRFMANTSLIGSIHYLHHWWLG